MDKDEVVPDTQSIPDWLARPPGRRLRGPEWSTFEFKRAPGCTRTLKRIAEDWHPAHSGDDIVFPAWLRLQSRSIPAVEIVAGGEVLGQLIESDAKRLHAPLRRLQKHGEVAWIEGSIGSSGSPGRPELYLRGVVEVGSSSLVHSNWLDWKSWIHLAYSFAVTFGLAAGAAYGASRTHGAMSDLLVLVAVALGVLGLLVVMILVVGIPAFMRLMRRLDN